ncbi:MAG: J domain-containing protein [Desulfosarcina sp.]
MDLKTSYDLLDLDPRANADQAKRAYKVQVRRWHPDRFPKGSIAQTEADERLKQINLAYARIKPLLARRSVPPGPAAPPPPNPAGRAEPSGATPHGHAWIDRLFEALNALTQNRGGKPSIQPDILRRPTPPKTFGQILDETAAGMRPQTKPRPINPVAASRRMAANCGRRRRGGAALDAVCGTTRPGPVTPVGRVRGIGRGR